MTQHFAVLDVETGGKKANENPITQFAIQIVDPVKFKTVARYDTYVKPYAGLEVQKAAIEYTKVTMAALEKGLDFKLLVAEIIKVSKVTNASGKSKPIIVGHNVSFDIEFLVYLFRLVNKDLWDYFDPIPVCTLRLTKFIEAGAKVEDAKRFDLTNVCKRYGVKLTDAHGAPQDVIATVSLLSALLNLSRQNKVNPSEVETTEVQEASTHRKNFEFVDIAD